MTNFLCVKTSVPPYEHALGLLGETEVLQFLLLLARHHLAILLVCLLARAAVGAVLLYAFLRPRRGGLAGILVVLVVLSCPILSHGVIDLILSYVSVQN